MGILSKYALQYYSKEYYHHVAAFPRYISQIHALCDDLKSRQVLLDNLMDEEMGDDNHPELWLRFVEGLGLSRDFDQITPELETTKRLVNGFFELVKKDYPTGLGALYAYERQTPEVSTSKINGLIQYYNITDEKSLKFFTIHAIADVWHTDELVKLINYLQDNREALKKVNYGAVEGAKLLWGFLDGINAHTSPK